ncbi:LysE family translocator [Thalassotalea eurytherma]|uniref:Lysine transporter LysE n=1 Tax=Thalassotalea eurytherma TaxID=1144278 RepID=A0ABQ6H476_9GAMM|nr:LysE family translocator [Thalassotalea eurytherma]GLX82314.1 lysine transporter LysE [Thalassotalea eurytherma]
MEQYIQEFLVIALVHLLAVASPGPDFAIILKQSIQHGRKTALYTSAGIGCGILVHVIYSLVGIGLIIATTPSLLSGLKYIAAAYFLYIAWHGLRAKAPATNTQQDNEVERLAVDRKAPSNRKAFTTGFLINALNVKATLFFVSLFSMVISIDTPTSIKATYGLYMAIATGLWFSGLSLVLSHHKIRNKIMSKGYWLDRIMGLVLLILAIELVVSDIG